MRFTQLATYLLFQEVEPRCGESLCKLFPSDHNLDIQDVVKKARKAHSLMPEESQQSFKDRPSTRTGGPMARRMGGNMGNLEFPRLGG